MLLITNSSDPTMIYIDLKNRIIELENQLSEKNAIISYLTKLRIKQYVVAVTITTINHKTKITKDKDNDTQLEKEDSSN